FGNVPATVAMRSAKEVTCMAHTGPKPIDVLPGTPGIAEVLPGFETWEWNGVFAPAGTDPGLIARLNEEMNAVFRAPATAARLAETEFVTGVAAMSASGRHGRTRACAGIIGMVDLTLGDKVDPLLESHKAIAGARFCGIRNRTAWHPSPEVTSNLVSPPPGPLENPAFHVGARRLAKHGLPLDVWGYHTQLP